MISLNVLKVNKKDIDNRPDENYNSLMGNKKGGRHIENRRMEEVGRMLKKIYQELLLIRKELQAIRSSMESSITSEVVEEINKEINKTGKSPLLI